MYCTLYSVQQRAYSILVKDIANVRQRVNSSNKFIAPFPKQILL